jgi:hypothetical protein
MTGLTSIGLSSKKQSKFSEDLELMIHQEQLPPKVHPSPVIALDKKVPQKSTSKASSKKSNKKKGAKRVPKKYTKPNLSKEKLSNKSLITEKLEEKDSLLESEVPKPHSQLNKHQGKDEGKEERKTPQRLPKTTSRFTTVGVKLAEIEKHGIIIEDQNESCDNSSDDSNSEDSVSSIEQRDDISDIDDDYTPPLILPIARQVSAPTTMQNKMFAKDQPIISEALSKLMKKDDHFFSLKDSTLAVPENHVDANSV